MFCFHRAIGFCLGVVAFAVWPVSAQDSRLPGDAQFQELAKHYREQAVKPALPDEARRYKAQAEVEIRLKNFEAAVRAYGEALRLAPWWPEGYHNRAVIQGELGNFDAALWDMERFLQLEPSSPVAGAAKERMYQWDYRSRSLMEETFAWDAARRSDDERQLTAYLEKYPKGRFSTLARDRLKEKQDAQPADQLNGLWKDTQNGEWRIAGAGRSFRIYPGSSQRVVFTGTITNGLVRGWYANFSECEDYAIKYPKTRCVSQVPAQLELSGEVAADAKMLQLNYQASEWRTDVSLSLFSKDTVTFLEQSRPAKKLTLFLANRCRDGSTHVSCYTSLIKPGAQMSSN